MVIGLTVALPLAALGIYHATLGRAAPSGVRENLASVQLTGPEGDVRITVPMLEAWEPIWPDAITGWFGAPFEASVGASSRLRINGAYVTENFFEVTGLELSRGRSWRGGDPPAMVLGEAVATRLFGSSEAALGSTVSIDGRSLTVLGLVRDGIRFPVNQQAWLPMQILTAQVPAKFLGQLPVQVIAHPPAAPGGREYFRDRLEDALEQRPDLASGGRLAAHLTPVFEAYVGDAVGPLRLFVIIAWCLFGIGAATTAHARNLEESLRRQEFSVREALGATFGQRVREVMARGALKGLVGGVGGGVLALLLMRLYTASGGLFAAYWVESGISRSLLLTGFGLIGAMTVLSSVMGVWYARGAGRAGLTEAVGTLAHDQKRLHRVLLFLEVAPAAGLLVLSFATSRAVLDAQDYWYGEDPERIVAVAIGLASEDASPTAMFSSLENRVEALSGVEEVGFVTATPVQRSPALEVELRGPGDSVPIKQPARVATATPDYLRVLGDPASALAPLRAPVAVVSSEIRVLRESLGGSPQLRVINGDEVSDWYDVTGTVPDLFLDWDLMEGAPLPRGAPGVLLIKSDIPRSGYLVARIRDGERTIRAIVDEVSHLGPQFTVGESVTYADGFSEAIRNIKIVNGILWYLTLLVLMLSTLGVYAVSLGQVSARTRELSIRAALGASALSLIRVVLVAVVLVAVSGAMAGGLLGWRVSELLQGAFLSGGAQASAVSLVCGVLVTLVASILGGLPPVVKLLRTPPGRTLRQD